MLEFSAQRLNQRVLPLNQKYGKLVYPFTMLLENLFLNIANYSILSKRFTKSCKGFRFYLSCRFLYSKICEKILLKIEVLYRYFPGILIVILRSHFYENFSVAACRF